MNDLTPIPPQQALAAHTDGTVAPYDDRVFHTYRTQLTTDRLCSDWDYYIEQQTLHKNEEEIATRVFIHDIRSHRLVTTSDIVIPKGPYWRHNAGRYTVIRKAQSDPGLLLLLSMGDGCRVVSVGLSGGGAACTVHVLRNGDSLYRVYNPYPNVEYDRPVYWRGRIYYISSADPAVSDNPGPLSLHRFDLQTDEDYTYPGEIFKPGVRDNKMLALNPGSGVLSACCTALGQLTQIDTADDAILARYAAQSGDPHTNAIFPSGSDARLFFTSQRGGIRYVDLPAGAPVFSMNPDAFSGLLSGIDGGNAFGNTLRQAEINAEESHAAFVLTGLNCKHFVIFDVQNQAIVLSCNLAEHLAFPLFCRQKMETLGFSNASVGRVEAAVRTLFLVYPIHSPLDLTAHDLQKTELPFPQTQLANAQEAAGYALYPTGYSWRTPANKNVVVHSLRLSANAEVDSLDISDRILSGKIKEGDYSWPALLYAGKGRGGDGHFLVTVNRQGGIETLDQGRSIADISGEYIARCSADEQRLMIYTRSHMWVCTIALSPGRRFYKARFSRKSGCINVFYYHPCFVERYSIARCVGGERSPETAFAIPDSFSYPFHKHNLEGPDGLLLYQIYAMENLRRRLRVTDMDTGGTRSDLPLPTNEIKAFHLEAVETGDQVVLLSDSRQALYINPFTMETLATLYLYEKGVFLLIACSQGREERYFYTNAPELVSVYEKDLTGRIRLLEKGDRRRVQYLQVYNSQKKLHDWIYNRARFQAEQQRLQTLVRLAAADRGLPVGGGAKRIAQGETEREET